MRLAERLYLPNEQHEQHEQHELLVGTLNALDMLRRHPFVQFDSQSSSSSSNNSSPCIPPVSTSIFAAAT